MKNIDKDVTLLCDKKIGAILGVSRTTLYRYRLNGMPYLKLGKSIRYALEEVIDWSKANAQLASNM